MKKSTFSLEDLGTFTDKLGEECSPESPSDGLSLEAMLDLADVNVVDYDSLMKARNAFADVVSEAHPDKRPIPPIINQTSDTQFLLTFDGELMIDFCCFDQKKIAMFIKQLSDIPANGTLTILTEMGFSGMNYLVMFDGLSAINILDIYPFKKVFNMDSSIGIVDLMVMMRCDEINIGKFASLSITHADTSGKVGGFIADTFNHIVKSTYDHWIAKGLFKQEEIDNLFENETDNAIYLSSSELKSRLG